MTVRFLGTLSEITGVGKLTALGQSVEVSEEMLRDAILGGCALLPDEEFEALGFSVDELKRYGDAYGRDNAPAEFWDKLRAGWVRVAEMRADFEGVN